MFHGGGRKVSVDLPTRARFQATPGGGKPAFIPTVIPGGSARGSIILVNPMAHRAMPDRLALDSLPDLLRPGLRLLSVGLNPSVPSLAAGFYFANPRNRFWPALRLAGLDLDLDLAAVAGVDAQALLLARGWVGFTDVVKRPTRGASDLRAADYRADAPLLTAKIIAVQPRVAWFHGKVAYAAYLRYALGAATRSVRIPWGEQAARIGAARVFVTPNPSPANARYSLDVLVSYYKLVFRAVDIATS